MTQSNSNEWWFSSLFRVAGYGLLAWTLIDIVDIFVPPRFTDPVWEFQTVRNLVERAPIPLLGLVFVLCSEKKVQIFKFLSWASLIVGILFILLIPFGINSAVRLDQRNQLQLSAQINQQTAKIQPFKDQLVGAKTDQEITQVLASLNPQGGLPAIANPQESKNKLLAEIAQAEKKVKAQADENLRNARLQLVKNAVKSLLGALVSGALFLTIWSMTSKTIKANRQRR